MGNKYLTEEEKNLIVKLHLENKNTVEISKVLKRNQSTVERYLKKQGFKMTHGKRISPEEEQRIVELYKNGMTCRDIFKEYSDIYHCEEAIQKIVRKNGVSRGRYKKPVVVNNDYFENIDTEHKAYWIGFMLADGCVMKTKDGQDVVKLELSYKDEDIIKEFAKDIETDREVKSYKYDYKHTSQIQIRSNKMSQDLAKYGVVYNKTFKLKEVPNIHPKLIRHLIRGYFDGDGCAYLRKPKDQYLHRITIMFCGTESFLDDLQYKVYKQIGLNTRKLIDMNKYGPNVYSLRYIKNEEVYKWYQYMYQDSTICLKRKKEKFEQFINERNKSNPL